MDFSNLMVFAEGSARSFYDTFNGSWMLDSLFTPFAEAITDFLDSLSFIDVPPAFTEGISIIFGDMSLALFCFSAIPTVVIFLAILSFLLDIIL